MIDAMASTYPELTSHMGSFLTPDLGRINQNDGIIENIDAFIGFIWADTIPNNAPQNVFAWIFSFFIIVVFIGGFMLFIRQGAAFAVSFLKERISDQNIAPRIRHLAGNKDYTTIATMLDQLDI